MDTHVKIIAWLYIVLGAMGLIGALCLGATLTGSGLISQDETAILATSIIGVVCGSFLFLDNILNIIAGVGLLKYKSWGRILAIIMGIISLFGFPIGTALGIYTLWVMFNKETEQLFKQGIASSAYLDDESEPTY